MSGQGYASHFLREILGKEHASPFFHSVPRWDVAACLRIKDKSVVNGRDWEVIWRVSDLKIYFGIDMAKDKFDYCAIDDSLNILCRGSNKENRNKPGKLNTRNGYVSAVAMILTR